MIALLGWVGSGLVVVSLLQHDIRRLRQVNLIAAATLGVFNLALGIASMIVLNVVLAGVNGFHLVKGRPGAPAGSSTTPAPADAIGSYESETMAGPHRVSLR